MPRLSRPTLNPKASSAWVTAFWSARDCATARVGMTANDAAMIPWETLGRETID
jgi:hypothetical protein